MSVHARRNLAPMTPVQTPRIYGASHEPAIVDQSSYDFDSAHTPFHPSFPYHRHHAYSSSSYPPIYEPTPVIKEEVIDCQSTMDTSTAHSALPVTAPPIPQPAIRASHDSVVAPPIVQSAVIVDMNMAKPGTVSATPGFLTPIAAHVGESKSIPVANMSRT